VKRGLYGVTGVILLVAGIALATLGTVVALSAGPDDAVSTAPARVRGTGVAVVAEGFRVDSSSIPLPDDLGTLTVTVTGRSGRAMFVGAAKPADVDTYLTGAPYDVVVDLTAGEKATTRKVPGSQQPQPPDSQGFWTVKSSGSPAELTARIPEGETLVVMNADASPVVDSDVVVTLRVTKVWTYAWIAVGVGVALGVLSVLLFWRARVAGRRRRDVAAGAAAEIATAATVAATTLPGPAVDAVPPAGPPTATWAPPVSVAPTDEDVVGAPPSAALAALVVEAGGPTDDETVEVPVVVPTPVPDPVVTDEDADPLFVELVVAHGADPVHDELPAVAADPATGPTPPGLSGDFPSSPPPTGD
jgi:hypothetical protein